MPDDNDLHVPADVTPAALEAARQEAKQRGARVVIDHPSTGLAAGPDGTITITPEQAGSKQEWDRALKLVDGDPSRIRVRQPSA